MLVIVAGDLVVGRTVAAQSTSRAPRHPDRARIRALAGCYHLTIGAWSTSTRLGPVTPIAFFRLDTLARWPGSQGVLAMERIAPAISFSPGDPRAQWKHPPSWRLVGADSFEITPWTIGTEAETFYGRVVGGKLRGVLRNTSDAMPVDARGRILWNSWPWANGTAERVTCDD